MFKQKIFIFVSLIIAFTPALAHCQDSVAGQIIKTIKGQVTKVDPVGNIIDVQIYRVDPAANVVDFQTDKGIMAFSISDQTKKVQDTHDIGLLDIQQGDPVTIQYNSSSPGKYTAISIVDNKPIVE